MDEPTRVNTINNEDIQKKSSKKTAIFITILVLVALAIMVNTMTGNVINQHEGTKVLFETTMGDIEIELYSDMPVTTENFKKLIQSGKYDGVIFHRIIDGFMIQGGDPTGTGYGDPSIPTIKDEFTHAGGNKNLRGTIAMANAGPNTGSSQFFINLVDNNFLDTKHPAFGKVISGMENVDKIAKVKTSSQDRPLEDVQIIKASILE